MSIYVIQIAGLILSFISCITFCVACYFQYRTMVMLKKDKKAEKLQKLKESHLYKNIEQIKEDIKDHKEEENEIDKEII